MKRFFVTRCCYCDRPKGLWSWIVFALGLPRRVSHGGHRRCLKKAYPEYYQ